MNEPTHYHNGDEDPEEIFVPAVHGVTPEDEDRALDSLLEDLQREAAEDAAGGDASNSRG